MKASKGMNKASAANKGVPAKPKMAKGMGKGSKKPNPGTNKKLGD